MTMARPRKFDGAKIVDQCAGCCLPDYTEGYCTAFDDPAYQWRKGECWGKCASAEEMIRRLQAIISYNELHGLNAAGVAEMRLELEGWQETVRVLEAEAI
jgi:hypothetical protein